MKTVLVDLGGSERVRGNTRTIHKYKINANKTIVQFWTQEKRNHGTDCGIKRNGQKWQRFQKNIRGVVQKCPRNPSTLLFDCPSKFRFGLSPKMGTGPREDRSRDRPNMGTQTYKDTPTHHLRERVESSFRRHQHYLRHRL